MFLMGSKIPNNEIWTRCSNPKGTDVKYPNCEVVL